MKKLAVGIIAGVAISEGRNFIKRKKEDIYFEKEGIEAVRRMHYKGMTTEMIAEILDMYEESVENIIKEHKGQ